MIKARELPRLRIDHIMESTSLSFNKPVSVVLIPHFVVTPFCCENGSELVCTSRCLAPKQENSSVPER